MEVDIWDNLLKRDDRNDKDLPGWLQRQLLRDRRSQTIERLAGTVAGSSRHAVVLRKKELVDEGRGG